MKTGVLLAGCGVYDGSEIHEAVFTLLSLDQAGAEVVCMAPDRYQHHVVNHINGEEMREQRNVLLESARIARGAIHAVDQVSVDTLDALIIPGGFGAAKNLNQWALAGPDGQIFPEVKSLIYSMISAGKPVCGLCMGPTVIAKALEGSHIEASLTVGTTSENSPYDIAAISEGMVSIGAKVNMKSLKEVEVDRVNKIVTAPCYMMEGSISEIHDNIQLAIKETLALI